MKKRIISFITALILIFNAFAIFTFAEVGEEQAAATEPAAYERLSSKEIVEKVGSNFIGGSDFDSLSLTDYPARYSGANLHSDEIKAALEAFGKRLNVNAPKASAITGTNGISMINNPGVINLVEEDGNKYLVMGKPVTHDDYATLAAQRYDSNNDGVITDSDALITRGVNSQGQNYYYNATYPPINIYGNATAFRSAYETMGGKSFVLTADIMAGASTYAKTYNLLQVSSYNSSYKSAHVDLLKLKVSAEGEYTLIYRDGETSTWSTLDVTLSKTEFTRLSLLIEPKTNSYSIMADGVCVKKDVTFLTPTQEQAVTYTDTANSFEAVGAEKYLPIYSRSFQVSNDVKNADGVNAFEYIDADLYYVDNFMMYYTDTFIECARHNPVSAPDACMACENCGETTECVDTGIEDFISDTDFADLLSYETYYNTAEDKTATTDPVKRLKIGTAKTFKKNNTSLALNNRMGIYDFDGEKLIIGKPVSEDFYKVNVGDDKQMNEVYLVFNNDEISSYTTMTRAMDEYSGRSFIMSGKFMGAESLGLADDASSFTMPLLNVASYKKSATSYMSFPLVDLEFSKDESGAPTYTIMVDGNNVGTLSTTEYTDVSVFIEPATNTFDCYVDGELVAENVTFISSASKNWQNTVNEEIGLTDQSDFILTGTKCCSIGSNYYSSIVSDILYVKSIDIGYADAHVTDTRAVKDGWCDVCEKPMLDVEGRNVMIKEDVSLNYYIDIADTVADTATVTLTNGKNTVTYKSKDVATGTQGIRKFSFDMTAIDLTAPVTVNITVDGKVSASYSSSVAEYALALLDDGTVSSEAKALAKAMLNYGAAAQNYFAAKYNDPEINSILANAKLPESDKTLTAPDTADMEGATLAGDFYPTAATLVLESKLSLKVYYRGSADDHTATVNGSQDVEIYREDGADEFAVVISGIMPTEYAADHTVVVTASDGTVSTVTVDVINLVKMILESGESVDDGFRALATAIYYYSRSAEAYIA